MRLSGPEDSIGQCQQSQLNVIKLSDSSTPGIITAITTGQTFDSAILTIATPRLDTLAPLLRLKLLDAKISHYNLSVNVDQEKPEEFISLQYESIEGTSFQLSPLGETQKKKFVVNCK